MNDYSLLIRAIDLNHNGRIDVKEIEKAKALGLNAKQGQPVETILTQNQENNLQAALKKIDETQKVDNKNLFEMSASMNKEQSQGKINENEDNNIKRKRFSALA